MEDMKPGRLLDPDDCHAIYEALEITSQSLDRPEPGAAERLTRLMEVFRGPVSARVMTVSDYADVVMTLIHRDQTEGFEWGATLPFDVASFSELHEHCDANEYILEAAIPYPTDGTDDFSFANAVTAEVDRRLADEAQRCTGNPNCPVHKYRSHAEPARPTTAELWPLGRTIFYEGDDPEGFRQQIRDEFGFDPADRGGTDVLTGEPMGNTWNERYGWQFFCPPEHLDAIYLSGRWPMGS